MQKSTLRPAPARPLPHLVRPMRVADIAQVMEVERQSFSSMWPPTAFKRELDHNHLARYLVVVQRREGAPGEGEPPPPTPSLGRVLDGLRHMVRVGGELPPPEERRELVVGFVGIWLLAAEAHIVTIAVRDSHRGRGIGELLLIATIDTTLNERQSVVTLECRVSNRVALHLYEKYRFQQVSLRPHYYSDGHEDAYVLSAGGIDTPSYRRLFQKLRDEHRRRWGEYERRF